MPPIKPSSHTVCYSFPCSAVWNSLQAKYKPLLSSTSSPPSLYWYFHISTVSVSLDRNRASVEHRTWYIFWKLRIRPTAFRLPFPRSIFAKCTQLLKHHLSFANYFFICGVWFKHHGFGSKFWQRCIYCISFEKKHNKFLILFIWRDG